MFLHEEEQIPYFSDRLQNGVYQDSIYHAIVLYEVMRILTKLILEEFKKYESETSKIYSVDVNYQYLSLHFPNNNFHRAARIVIPAVSIYWDFEYEPYRINVIREVFGKQQSTTKIFHQLPRFSFEIRFHYPKLYCTGRKLSPFENDEFRFYFFSFDTKKNKMSDPSVSPMFSINTTTVNDMHNYIKTMFNSDTYIISAVEDFFKFTKYDIK